MGFLNGLEKIGGTIFKGAKVVAGIATVAVIADTVVKLCTAVQQERICRLEENVTELSNGLNRVIDTIGNDKEEIAKLRGTVAYLEDKTTAIQIDVDEAKKK